ncbi:MAG: IS1634 family transposase [Pedosphaera sp. Tous-C6FEB]|nr:MAG: IS1634 family transposase [Pedosphaera sp. Tous-C6FEB]
MFLKCSTRRKDGKEHRSWSVVESRRVGRSVVQRHVLYLGEINDSQRAAWQKSIAVFDEAQGQSRQCALFPEDRAPAALEDPASVVQVRLSHLQLARPRTWGACWLGDQLWRDLQLDTFFAPRLGCSREGTDWEKVLRVLTLYRLLSPGSQWRLHRHWFATTALADLLGVDERLAQDDTLYRGLDGLLEHKDALFAHLRGRWSDLFGAQFEVLLYDLTSTYFECDVPEDEQDPRRFGYSRDKRSDCVPVVVALVVTPEGLPLAYEMFPGNTADKTTLRDMLALIQKRHGQAQRIWVMDRGIPTEAVLEELRQSDAKVSYLVGTPKGRLTKLEKELAQKPWQQVRPQLRVKLLPQEGEVYVLAESGARTDKERAMRRRKLRALWQRLHELQGQDLPRDQRLEKLGAARDRAGRAVAGLVQTAVSAEGKLTFTLDRKKLRALRRREGRYLLRTNLSADNPELLWRCYMQLVFVEEAFRTLKGDLGLRPIYHHKAERIEAHLFVAFLAYCLSITLRQRLKALAGGLMPRVVLEKLADLQLLDVRVPTTDGRELLLVRRTEPDRDVALLLARLKLTQPPQPPPRISPSQTQ